MKFLWVRLQLFDIIRYIQVYPSNYATYKSAITFSLRIELNRSTIHSLLHPWMHHCHWSQSMWALCQDCHGPTNATTIGQIHTRRWGHIKPSPSPGFFVPLSALVGRAIKGSTPTWEQYLSSPKCPQISLGLTQSLLHSHCFLSCFLLLFCPTLCPSSLHLSVCFCPFFLLLPVTPVLLCFLHLNYLYIPFQSIS